MKPGARRWPAPLLAGLIVGAVYLSRVDSNFYFLFGAEAQGILLAEAMASGQGMVDLALPGHPAHVREPPLFYFTLSLLIRAFGPRMLPMKLLMWAGYALAGAFTAALFQRRGPPWLAGFAAVFILCCPDFFRTATGPKSDLPFAAVALAALLLIETVLERAGGAMTRRDWVRATGAGTLIAAAVMMRSLGLALPLAALGTLFLRRPLFQAGGLGWLRPRLLPALLLTLPAAAVVGGWSARGAATANPAGYSYTDWFLMDLAPDSPEMTAVDFHAPLLSPVPRLSPAAAAWRAASHLPFYGSLYGGLLFDGELGARRGGGPGRLFLLLLPVMLLGLWTSERGRPPLLPLFLLIYSTALLTWPMNDQRLTYPLLPLTGGFLVLGLARLCSLGRAATADGRRRGALLAAALLLPFLAANLRSNFNFDRRMRDLPTIELHPGFTVRFQSPETMRGFRLLVRARQLAAPGAVLMYHSPPPCRLVSGHDCQAIPFSADRRRVRDYLVGGGADYLVIDEYGRILPGGPGWLTEHVLRPTVASYPADFEAVVTGEGASGIWRVRR